MKATIYIVLAALLAATVSAKDWTTFCEAQPKFELGMDCDDYLKMLVDYGTPYKLVKYTTFNAFDNEFPYWEARLGTAKTFVVCEGTIGLEFVSRKAMTDYNSYCVRQRQHW